MADFTPTPEQQQAIDLYLTGVTFAIEAGAGAGKTSTFILLAEATPQKRIQFIAFNKDIVTDAGTRMPPNVSCNTAHSLAYRATPKPLLAKMRRPFQKSGEIADRLGIREGMFVQDWAGDPKNISRTFLGGLVIKAIENFCQSADAEPTYQCVPAIPGLDSEIVKGQRGSGRVKGPGWETVARAMVPYLRKAWADLMDPRGGLRFEHSHYLKRWQLSKPRIAADVILFDEAQDANPCMNAIVGNQKHAQIVWVGDSQQEIYAWAGAVNALAKVPAESRTFLTQSFRFGPAIAAEANRILDMIPEAEIRLVGFDQVDSRVEEVEAPDAILCRTNAGVLKAIFGELEAGRRTAIVGGADEIKRFAWAARDLQNGKRTDHLELGAFEDWDEVQRFVHEDARGGDFALMVKVIDEHGVDRILDMIERVRDTRKPGVVAGRDYDVAVSTAHKAKGREWDAVRLTDDFPETPQGNEELRLLYVAVTRARKQLDIAAVALLNADALLAEMVVEPETAPEPASPAVDGTARVAVPRDESSPENAPETPSRTREDILADARAQARALAASLAELEQVAPDFAELDKTAILGVVLRETAPAPRPEPEPSLYRVLAEPAPVAAPVASPHDAALLAAFTQLEGGEQA